MSLLELILEPDNPCNTAIFSSRGDTDQPVYTVSTNFGGKNPVTVVRDANENIIGGAEWRDAIRGDKITFGSGSNAVEATGWLKKNMIPFKDTVQFDDGNGGKFKWKRARSLVRAPVARFYKSRTDRSTTLPTLPSAKLVVAEGGERILDMVVMSFLFLEKNRRVNETGSQNRADVSGVPFTRGNYKLRDGGF